MIGCYIDVRTQCVDYLAAARSAGRDDLVLAGEALVKLVGLLDARPGIPDGNDFAKLAFVNAAMPFFGNHESYVPPDFRFIGFPLWTAPFEYAARKRRLRIKKRPARRGRPYPKGAKR